jgi:hypothetical protein
MLIVDELANWHRGEAIRRSADRQGKRKKMQAQQTAPTFSIEILLVLVLLTIGDLSRPPGNDLTPVTQRVCMHLLKYVRKWTGP